VSPVLACPDFRFQNVDFAELQLVMPDLARISEIKLFQYWAHDLSSQLVPISDLRRRLMCIESDSVLTAGSGPSTNIDHLIPSILLVARSLESGLPI